MPIAPQDDKPTKALTSRAIEAMKPASKELADSGENRGLRVTCGAKGIKTFVYRYRSPLTRKLVQISIGHYPTVSLAEARLKCSELKLIRANGRCPATEQRERAAVEAKINQEKNLSATFTVRDMVELYLTQHIEDRKVDGRVIPGARKSKGQSETRRTLYGDAVRVLGDHPAANITRKDITSMVMAIIERGANVQAGSVLRELSAAYEYAIGLEKLPDTFANPALLAKAGLRQAKIKLTSERGKRVLSEAELKKLLQWLPGSAYTTTQKNILRFTLWTGCRTGEVCAAEWRDIDLDKKTWHLRDTKTGVERYVQLSHQAVEFLKVLSLTTGDYLFPSIKGKKPLQQKQLTEQAWRLRTDGRMLDIEPWTPHDLRRTVRTGLSRLGCPNEIAEAILGHSRSGIEGTYDLHKYEKECAHWLQVWADFQSNLL
ncbi:MAG TPA: tyrosine-type recombinase/integrase [Cellvibrionaceae bacterium]|nr:tyrosine-type recombinase/integrase [Cellvibrionaceae bacterium]HMW72808.1 tyrosine-type recombinase/integrase [Cellvibrionaceae bacterium]HNG58378.1 tyrosine-type recombinase/integrase [Cellvibrionaceae bacterium]